MENARPPAGVFYSAIVTVAGTVVARFARPYICSAIAGADTLAAPDRRGETLALLFLIAYGGLVVPVLFVGWSLTFAAETTVLLVFAAAVLAELGSPGFLAGLVAHPLSAMLVACALVLQALAVVLIRRLLP